MAITVGRATKILFIGDSITDCHRREDAEGVGDGYVRLIRDYLRVKHLADAPTVINAGISGNRITDLQDRWQSDVLEKQPDILSIMIGINDVWHGLDGGTNGVSIERYVIAYHVILRLVQFALPNCRVVLCEPTVIEPPAAAEGNARLQPYVRSIAELTREFRCAAMVPLHNTFVNARKSAPEIKWVPDGVHPSSSGHMLIANAWLKATGLL